MTDMLAPLRDVSKLLFEIPLKPVQGQRFQPTGFPSLGAATYQTPNGTSLLVESPQSMANRLELTCWDEALQKPRSEVDGISYVHVNGPDGFLTSSILEAHRLNSGYIRATKEEFHATLREEIGVVAGRPINRTRFAQALFKYDLGSLVHGVFLESIDGRLRVARSLSAFIEANRVERAVSGGVKTDMVDLRGDPKPDFGMVPFVREEFLSDDITLYVNCDLAQIRGYGLATQQQSLLVLLHLFKLRQFLSGSLRLRTACDLTLKNGHEDIASGNGFMLPKLADLTAPLEAIIRDCRDHMAGKTELTFDPSKRTKAKKKGTVEESDSDDDTDDEE